MDTTATEPALKKTKKGSISFCYNKTKLPWELDPATVHAFDHFNSFIRTLRNVYPPPLTSAAYSCFYLFDENGREISEVSNLRPGGSYQLRNVLQSTFEFYTGLRNADTSDARWMVLREPAFIDGSEWNGRELFVRESYVKLKNKIFKHFGSKNGRGTIVTKSSGVGATYFSYYLAHCILVNDPAAVIVFEHEGSRIRLETECVVRGSKDDFHWDLEKESTWYLADGVCPQICHAKTIQTIPPERKLFKRFAKGYGVSSFYLPPWTMKEFDAVFYRRHNDGVNTLQQMEQCFSYYGGIARYVLRCYTAQEKRHRRELEDAIARTDLSNAVMPKDLDLLPMSEEVLHVLPTDRSFIYSLVFGSKHIQDTLAKYWMSMNREEMIEFFKKEAHSDEVKTSMGMIYESLVHKKVARGGRFSARNLRTGASFELSIPAETLPVQLFHRVEDISPGRYNRPSAPEFGAVDAVFPEHGYLQMTINKEHGVNAAALSKVRTKVDAAHHRIFFVVPEMLFDEYPLQEVIAPRRATTIAADDLNWVQNIEQYVISVDIDGYVPSSEDL